MHCPGFSDHEVQCPIQATVVDCTIPTDVALSFDIKSVAIRSIVLVQGLMAPNRFPLHSLLVFMFVSSKPAFIWNRDWNNIWCKDKSFMSDFFCPILPYEFLHQSHNHLNNSSSPGGAYMRQWIRPALVQIIAFCLFGAKPLSKPMLAYWPVGKNFTEILIKIQKVSFAKLHLKIVREMAAILSRGRWVYCAENINVKTASWKFALKCIINVIWWSFW